MSRHYLGEFEEIVLLLVARFEGEGYGVNITHEIIQLTDRNTRLNQVHSALVRLEEKGMIRSKMSEPVAERGGRSKRMFTITAYGRKALVEIKNLRATLWNELPPSIQTADNS